MDANQAIWRPAPRRKSIWGLTLHIAYWKYTVLRHLEPGPIPRFPRSPSNWPAPPSAADEAAWTRDVKLLKEQHRLLVSAVAKIAESTLPQVPPAGRRWTYGQLVLGIAAHDAYHTGQIQLMKKLWHERRARSR